MDLLDRTDFTAEVILPRKRSSFVSIKSISFPFFLTVPVSLSLSLSLQNWRDEIVMVISTSEWKDNQLSISAMSSLKIIKYRYSLNKNVNYSGWIIAKQGWYKISWAYHNYKFSSCIIFVSSIQSCFLYPFIVKYHKKCTIVINLLLILKLIVRKAS